MFIFKVVAIAIVVTIAALVIKQNRPDLAMLVSAAGGVVLLVMILGQFTAIFSFASSLATKTGIDQQIFSPICKIIGIGYLAEFGASVCEDAGNKSMAGKVILGAKVVILILSLPVLSLLVDTIVSVL